MARRALPKFCVSRNDLGQPDGLVLDLDLAWQASYYLSLSRLALHFQHFTTSFNSGFEIFSHKKLILNVGTQLDSLAKHKLII
jgi:hypothetical protein